MNFDMDFFLLLLENKLNILENTLNSITNFNCYLYITVQYICMGTLKNTHLLSI